MGKELFVNPWCAEAEGVGQAQLAEQAARQGHGRLGKKILCIGFVVRQGLQKLGRPAVYIISWRGLLGQYTVTTTDAQVI